MLLALLLVACAPTTSPGDALLLHVARRGFLGLVFDHSVYAVRADGSGGALSFNLPSGLGLEPRWSPDRRWIAFVNERPGNVALHIVRSDGSRRLEYQADPMGKDDPTWSPDSTRIAYTGYSDSKYGIKILDVACLLRGEVCQPKPTFLVEGGFADWSPDAKRIVYQSTWAEGGIFVVAADGRGDPVSLTPDRKYCFRPRWSPDGQRILFSCHGVLYTMNADGTGLTKLMESGFFPTWSPAGSKIAFISARDGLGKCIGGLCGSGGLYSSAVFLMDADGSNVIRLSKRDDEQVLWYTWLPAQPSQEKR